MENITSRKNRYITHLRSLAADGAYRRSRCEYAADGIKLLREALASGAEVTSVLWKGQAESIALPAGCDEYTAPEDLFDYASPMKNSPGPVFTVRMPADAAGDFTNAIVLENVQDPGNVGTVIRTANAFGIGAVILTGACADLYSPKTVRATMGAIFRQRVMTVPAAKLPALLKEHGLPLYGAALDESSADIRGMDIKNAAVAIGSEGQGLSAELISMCRGLLIIPMQPCSESLNAGVAASVVMWEMAR